MIVHIACRKGSDALVVKRIWRSCSRLDDIAFIQLEFHFAGHILLGGLDESLNCLADRCEPLAFIYDLGEFISQIFLQRVCIAVKDQFLQLLMCLVEDRSTGCFIDAAGLHAHYAVLHDIYDTDAVFAAQFI